MINSKRVIKRFGLLGYPLGHSVSPFIHTALTRAAGIECEYRLYETEPEALETEYNNTLSALDGFNVTVPFKTEVISRLDGLSERASLFGAVNTVKLENGKAVGYNTDCTGFLRALEGAGISLGGDVLILGSGGVSRMFVFESLLAGADVTVAVRESGIKKAESVKSEAEEKLNKSIEIITLDYVCRGYDLVINGTPVGMYPNTEASPLEMEKLTKSKAVFDAVYNPLETRFIQYAKEAGLKYANGLSMLVWQAAAAEEIWNGISFDNETVNRIINLTEKELGK